MRQAYTWRITPPTGRSVDGVCDALVPPAERMLDKNRYITSVDIDLDEEFVDVILTMQGHDRWWVSKRAPGLIRGLAIGAKLPINSLEHLSIKTVPTLRNASFWTEGGQHGNRTFFNPDPDGEPGPLTIRRCKTCKEDRDPRYFLHRSGWKTGPEAYR